MSTQFDIVPNIFDRLISNPNLPRYFDKDPKKVNGISLIYAGTAASLTIRHHRMYVSVRGGSGTSLNIDLQSYTSLNALVIAINLNTGYTATLTGASTLSPLSLMDVTRVSIVGSAVNLSCFTSLLWQILKVAEWAVQDSIANSDSGLRETSIVSADGAWLDYWGLVYGNIRRMSSEVNPAPDPNIIFVDDGIGSIAVPAGNVSMALVETTLGLLAPVPFIPAVQPSWNTNVYTEDLFDPDGFTVDFSVPAPTVASIDWLARLNPPVLPSFPAQVFAVSSGALTLNTGLPAAGAVPYGLPGWNTGVNFSTDGSGNLVASFNTPAPSNSQLAVVLIPARDIWMPASGDTSAIVPAIQASYDTAIFIAPNWNTGTTIIKNEEHFIVIFDTPAPSSEAAMPWAIYPIVHPFLLPDP